VVLGETDSILVDELCSENERDWMSAVLLVLNGHQPELGLALFTVAHRGDFAVTGQYSNSPVGIL
jgi:hypothetical protein